MIIELIKSSVSNGSEVHSVKKWFNTATDGAITVQKNTCNARDKKLRDIVTI